MEKIKHKMSTGFIAVLFFSCVTVLAQSDWKVEDAKAKIKNPVTADVASIKEGQTLFMTNCKTCHGDPGKNNGLPLVPKPRDMADVEFLSANSDGAIYTKITEGKVTMPTFKAVLSETQRWQIVNYIRSLDKNKVLVVDSPVAKSTISGVQVNAPFQISLTYTAATNQLVALVVGTSVEGELIPASGIEVGFFMQRYFGDLPFGVKGSVTDENGLIEAPIPVDLPGGKEGKALAYAKLSDVDTFGEVVSETEVNVKSVEIINLKDQRSLWTVRVMSPWWLIFTYFGILIGVWGTLGYVVFQLFKLKKAGV